MGAGSHSMCVRDAIDKTYACITGCAAEGTLTFTDAIATARFTFWNDNLGRLCNEASEAQAGQACAGNVSFDSCLPVHARLAADGSVESQPFLRCGGGICSAAAPPAAAAWQPCDASILALHPNESGVVRVGDAAACLLANGQSAITKGCLGDWDCPQGQLCDGALPMLDGDRLAVCKPGPRGTLTPAMLL